LKTSSESETRALARELGRRHPQGGAFYLSGDLGAGKTIFAKGLASAYGVDPDEVVSPTFSLVNRYGGGERPVYHVDLYRIGSERELVELGLEDMEDEAGAVMMVEWAERLGRRRRGEAVSVQLRVVSEREREIVIEEGGTP
jgi:tRNA threonylcarbamoyladenosine biosynthesis protein TsaE